MKCVGVCGGRLEEGEACLCAVCRYFTWDSGKFPTPADMLNRLAKKGRKVCCSQYACLPCLHYVSHTPLTVMISFRW